MVVFVDVVVPDRNNREKIVKGSQPRVKDKEQEVSLVLQADTVVGERAVVAHLEDAGVADGAVVGPCWLELVAVLALAVPETLQIRHRFRSVLHQALHVFLQALESVVFLDCLILCAV